MRRRPRIDLGQPVAPVEEERLERKRKRWSQVNKDRPEHENPFLAAIKPTHENYGDKEETEQELRARLENLEFGNYPGYFKYRNKSAINEHVCDGGDQKEQDELNEDGTNEKKDLTDERINLMKKEWFSGKNVLDIGCNEGYITYAIAKSYSPNIIIGIDVDSRLVNMASRGLHMHLEESVLKGNNELRIRRAHELIQQDVQTDDIEQDKQYIECPDHYPLVSYVNQGPLITNWSAAIKCDKKSDEDGNESNNCLEDMSDRGINTFPNNIMFLEHNYVLANDKLVEKQNAHFDTIVCLSVTKWIHLNYRDEGIKRFFRRIHRHIKPGGLLVLETQPYDNYYRKKKLSDRLRKNYYSIKFKPDQFDEYLLSNEVGFKEIIYSTKTDHQCKGFKRPLRVFMK